MSQEEAVEHITKVPTELQAPKKEKNPKKIAAGKKLAEYNKKAKEALEREKKREAEKKSDAEGDTSESIGWYAQSFGIGVLVVGLTAINLFSQYWDKSKSEPPTPPPNTPITPPSKIPVLVPKVGMQ